MTLRTTSATRRTVVSRSSDVATASATSSSNDSTGKRSGLEITEPIVGMIAAAFPVPAVREGSGSKGVSEFLALCGSTLFSGHNANVGEVTIFLRVVQSVANHKFVRNLETNVVAIQGELASR